MKVEQIIKDLLEIIAIQEAELNELRALMEE